jgi:hypothetical protein
MSRILAVFKNIDSGRIVTNFSNEEEKQAGSAKQIPYSVETKLKEILSFAMVNCSWVESMRGIVRLWDLGYLLMDNLSLAPILAVEKSSATPLSKSCLVIKLVHELGMIYI